MIGKTMKCAYCGHERKYPQDFPLKHWAKCRFCYSLDGETEELKVLWRVPFTIYFVAKHWKSNKYCLCRKDFSKGEYIWKMI